jgi:hypothetical protein
MTPHAYNTLFWLSYITLALGVALAIELVERAWRKRKRKKSEMPMDDDWTPQVGLWYVLWVCHCNKCAKPAYPHDDDVCPVCGHRDKWQECVVRKEWMHSIHRQVEGMPYEKDLRFVRWTEADCPVKEEK